MKKLDIVQMIHEIGFGSENLLNLLDVEICRRYDINETVSINHKLKRFVRSAQSKYQKWQMTYSRFML